MRISTSMMFDMNVGAMGQQQSNLLDTQLKLDSGKRINTPADDPAGAAQVIGLSQAASLNSQYASNRVFAKNNLQLEDSTLGDVTNVIQHIQSQTIRAGDASLSDKDRAAIASDLQTSYDQLLALANTQDSNGQYLFAGFQGATKPFVDSGTGGAFYIGDQGQRQLQVSPSRQMAANDSGSDVFSRVIAGMSGTVVAGNPANTGSASISPASIVNAADPAGSHNFEISFQINTTLTPPTYNYTVTDKTDTTATPVTAAYTPGSPLTVAMGGKQITLTGNPANADKFTVQPAEKAGTNLFNSLKDLISALQASSAMPGGQANVTNALTTAGQKFSNSLNNVLTVRATVGSRLSELTSLDSQGSDRNLQYQSQLSQLQDLDYTSAISTFSQQMTALQASQQAFVQVRKLSLFNLL